MELKKWIKIIKLYYKSTKTEINIKLKLNGIKKNE